MKISEKMVKEIHVKLDDEKIGEIADKFPEMYLSEQEYIEFNEKIADIVFACTMSLVHEEVGKKAAQEGMEECSIH